MEQLLYAIHFKTILRFHRGDAIKIKANKESYLIKALASWVFIQQKSQKTVLELTMRNGVD